MEQSVFEQLVTDAMEALPERFRERLSNVAFFVEADTRRGRRSEHAIKHGVTLLGLYEGIPHTERWHYNLALPDRITLFQHAIEAYATHTGTMVENVVRDTLFHEIAHHFGFTEAEVRRWEQQRTTRKRPRV